MAYSTMRREAPPERHFGHVCLNCNAADFPGRRYACWICLDYQICGNCYDANQLPTSPHHKYYHPMETNYTLSEFRLFFGNDLYLADNVPQSYKCAICNEYGFGTSEELYFHLNSSHAEHTDYEDYSGILMRRRAVEAAVGGNILAPSTTTATTGGGEGGGGEANGFQCSIVDVTEPPLVTQEVPPEIPPLVVDTSSVEESSDLSASSREVPRFHLEVIPLASDNENQYKLLGDQAVKLIEELDSYHPGQPDYIKRSLHILMKARGLRRQLQQLPVDRTSDMGLQAASTESFLCIIEHEVSDNFTRQRQFQNRQRSSMPGVPSAFELCRRGALAPGSLAASAASRVAAAALANNAATDILAGGPIRRRPLPFRDILSLETPGIRRQRRPPPPLAGGSPGMSRRNRETFHHSMMVSLEELFPNAGLRSNRSLSTMNNVSFRPPVPAPKPPIKPPVQFVNLVTDIIGETPAYSTIFGKSAKKLLDSIEEDNLPRKADGRFLLSKLKPIEGEANVTDSTKQSNHSRFIESVLCSMLAEEKLFDFPNDTLSIEKDSGNIPISLDESLNITETEELLVNNSSDLEMDLMYRFYKGLNGYKEWQTKFNDNLASKNISKADSTAAASENVSPPIINEASPRGRGVYNEMPPPAFIYGSEEENDEVDDNDDDEEEEEHDGDGNTTDQNNESSLLNVSLNESVDVEDGDDGEEEGEEEDEGEEENNESGGEGEWEDYEDNESESDLSDVAFSHMVDSLDHVYDY